MNRRQFLFRLPGAKAEQYRDLLSREGTSLQDDVERFVDSRLARTPILAEVVGLTEAMHSIGLVDSHELERTKAACSTPRTIDLTATMLGASEVKTAQSLYESLDQIFKSQGIDMETL